MEPEAITVDLIVTSVRRDARCRQLDTGESLLYRATEPWELIPGEIVTVRVRKRWRFGRQLWVSGAIVATRLDLPALRLTPLRLEPWDDWDPQEEYWGEEGDPLPDWTVAIIERGPRPAFEMEQILPGVDWDDPDGDPIVRAADLKAVGRLHESTEILMDLLQEDLRCLDAHAHLGNVMFDSPQDAIRHYEVGVRIGEISLGPDFEGVLPWRCVDNRPFLRCLHGYGLCLWRLGRFDEAAQVFERMLWMNPSDNQGVRILLPVVRDGEPWTE